MGYLVKFMTVFWILCIFPVWSHGTTDRSGWAYRLPQELMSPYCPGRALSECPSPQADELRLWILGQEEEGFTRSEVEEVLFQRFGDQLLQAPRVEGVGLIAYLVPALIILFGGVGLVVFLLRQRSIIMTREAQSLQDSDYEREGRIGAEVEHQ